LIITLSISISLCNRISYNNLAKKIGNDILYRIYQKEYFNKKNKSDFKFKSEEKMTIETLDDLKTAVTSDNIIKLGDLFLTVLQRFPHNLFEREILKNSYYTGEAFKLVINTEFLEIIKQNIIINPNTLPMLCQPVKWYENVYGGYLTNSSRRLDIITGLGEISHKVENKNSIYKAVNFLNSIKFSINKNLLNYLLSHEGSYILDIVKADDELQRFITLKIAQIFKNTYFYLNTHADWRGRLYTQSFYISYQSGDLSTALLNFSEGESITEEGRLYLYIYGANNHNIDQISKASLLERLKWVQNNYQKIINLDKELISTAENPFIFTAFCLNMREIHNNPKAKIYTPVFLDATCSGIQHFAAILKDLELGINTNLIPSTIEDKPGDIYNYLVKPINDEINKYGEKNSEHSQLFWVKLSRREVKTAVMTKVYNVSTYGISQQLKNLMKSIFVKDSLTKENISKNLETHENKFIMQPVEKVENSLKKLFNFKNTVYLCPDKNGGFVHLTNSNIYKIADIINKQIFVVFPSLYNIYNYFINITKLTIKLGIPLTWITPSGVEITQKYFYQKSKVITISLFGHSKKIVYRETEDKLNNIKQINATIPNIIHSLDASHLINLINSMANGKDTYLPVISVHDCFGTHPNHMGKLEFEVKKNFILLYSNSQFIENYHNRFIRNLTDNHLEIITKDDKQFINLNLENKIEILEIPSIPKLGVLDIENIINSKYMIS
jgi:DNA-directed RNA polymerase